jgi:squalene-hopene/tetraprenyl-beta-curcumene cyclase
VKVKDVEPGGWAFEFDNQLYPDTDDAAEILLAIGRANASDPASRDEAVERGMNWVLSMQSKNGGWGSFDKDNMSRFATKLPFFDFGETIDPPSVDVTAHIVETICRLGWAGRVAGLDKAIDYILREQESDGPWFGRWGVNYIYGTAAVLPALESVGWDMTEPRVQKAVNWVESRQNPDGGWGETCASYANPALRGTGNSTASQTAWALMSLIAAGRVKSDAAKRGMEYLLRTQSDDGSWEEPQYTATGFPGYGIGDRRFKNPEGGDADLLPDELPSGFMIKYHMYRVYWPLLALGRYRASSSGGGTASGGPSVS